MGIKKMEKKVKEKETSNEIKRKYIKLKKEVNQHNKLYYQDNKPKKVMWNMTKFGKN